SALEDAIAQAFASLIAQAVQRHSQQPQDDIKDLINERLKLFRLTKGPLRKARRPGPHVKEGTATPTGRGGKHTTAKETQPGDTFTLQRWPSMEYVALGVDGPLCDVTDDVFLINTEHPCMVAAQGDDRLLQRETIYAIAIRLGTDNPTKQMVFSWGEPHGAADRIEEIVKILSGLPMPRRAVSAAS